MTARAVGATLAAAVTALAPCPAGATTQRQSGSITWTARTPKAPTGFIVDLKFRNPENPALKPHTAKRMVVYAPRGAVTDTAAPPQCHASDAELMLLGPSACPPQTKVGEGRTVSDNGGGSLLPRYTHATLTNFNNRDEVIGSGVVEELPALKPVDRTRIKGRTSTTDFPLFPGHGAPDPYTPFKSLHVVFPRYVRAGRAYIRTPPRCPARGFWTIAADFTYVDGVTQRLTSRSPCRRPRKRTSTRRAEERDGREDDPSR